MHRLPHVAPGTRTATRRARGSIGFSLGKVLPFKPLPEEPHVTALRRHGWQRVSGGHRSRDEQPWTHPDLPGHLITFERDYDDDIERRPNATRYAHVRKRAHARFPRGWDQIAAGDLEHLPTHLNRVHGSASCRPRSRRKRRGAVIA